MHYVTSLANNIFVHHHELQQGRQCGEVYREDAIL